jgi:hypothetical protein
MFKKAYASVMALFRFGQKAPHSLPLNPNHLRLFGQKTIGDGGFERLADGFFMRRMSIRTTGTAPPWHGRSGSMRSANL